MNQLNVKNVLLIFVCVVKTDSSRFFIFQGVHSLGPNINPWVRKINTKSEYLMQVQGGGNGCGCGGERGDFPVALRNHPPQSLPPPHMYTHSTTTHTRNFDGWVWGRLSTPHGDRWTTAPGGSPRHHATAGQLPTVLTEKKVI